MKEHWPGICFLTLFGVLLFLITNCGIDCSEYNTVTPYLGQPLSDFPHRELRESKAAYDKYYVKVLPGCKSGQWEYYFITVEHGTVTAVWSNGYPPF